jgi:NADPH:quinone reductase
MKAIVLTAFGSSDNFVDAELPLPPLRHGDVRIRIKAVSFNPVDCQIRKGGPESKLGQSMILGRDLSGTVDAVHESVTDFSVGDDVYSYVCTLASSGTYAEYVSVPAELVARKPSTLTHEQAAAVPVAGITASMALCRTGVGITTSLFVAGGAGGVGSFALMLARQLGVRRLITTAGGATSRDHLTLQCGLRSDQIVDYKDSDFATQALHRNGGEFDVALDLVGGRMLSACCDLLAVDGILASCTEAASPDDFETLFSKNALFHSVGANAYSLSSDRTTWRKYRDMLDGFARLYDAGDLAPPTISHVGSLSSDVVRRAHALLESGAVQGKLVASSCGSPRV